MDIKEGNKLIALFDGWEANRFENLPNKLHRMNDGQLQGVHIESLEYHTSWDWLMPVVEKANTLNTEIQKTRPDKHYPEKDLDDASGWRAWSYRYIHLSTNIQQVWEKTVEFIQWKNNQA